MDIQKLRDQNNLTRKDFSKLIGCSMNTLSNWENHRTSPQEHFIYKINKTFQIKSQTVIHNRSKYEKLIDNCIKNIIKNNEDLDIKNFTKYSGLSIYKIHELFENKYSLVTFIINKYECEIENEIFNTISKNNNIKLKLNLIYKILYKNMMIINYLYKYQYISLSFIKRIKFKVNVLFSNYENERLEKIIFNDIIIEILNIYLKNNNPLNTIKLTKCVENILNKRIIDL